MKTIDRTCTNNVSMLARHGVTNSDMYVYISDGIIWASGPTQAKCDDNLHASYLVSCDTGETSFDEFREPMEFRALVDGEQDYASYPQR